MGVRGVSQPTSFPQAVKNNTPSYGRLRKKTRPGDNIFGWKRNLSGCGCGILWGLRYLILCSPYYFISGYQYFRPAARLRASKNTTGVFLYMGVWYRMWVGVILRSLRYCTHRQQTRLRPLHRLPVPVNPNRRRRRRLPSTIAAPPNRARPRPRRNHSHSRR